MMQEFPTDNNAYRFPVSVKGVVFNRGDVLLLRNERDEWELPGGKLELGEDPPYTVVRELREELGIAVEPDTLLDAWVYHIADGVDVLILTYGCHSSDFEQAIVSNEHNALGRFDLKEIASLNMPDGYKRSIAAWQRRVALKSEVRSSKSQSLAK
jgi:8-oxo-dGTP pyrophosphatase MutT (NUDIX family)